MLQIYRSFYFNKKIYNKYVIEDLYICILFGGLTLKNATDVHLLTFSKGHHQRRDWETKRTKIVAIQPKSVNVSILIIFFA